MCGEKTHTFMHLSTELGSPPRVRGKDYLPHPARALLRITPACAGKSGAALTCPPETRDHPRVCGEKQTKLLRRQLPQGSPPRVRGKGDLLNDLLRQLGITPACAGKRWSRRNTSLCYRDHPRVCGEKVLQIM